jgi:hypothetical protein
MKFLLTKAKMNASFKGNYLFSKTESKSRNGYSWIPGIAFGG